jgi:hypothetical protein
MIALCDALGLDCVTFSGGNPMSKKLLLSAAIALTLMFAASVHADTVVASGAGSLPGTAEDLTGVNVTEIQGSIPDQLGVNMFEIDITDFTNFSAITTGPGAFGIPDTELFLFDSTGLGVMANDDIDGGNTLSCLPSAGPGNPCSSTLPSGVGPTSDGDYFLAITRSQQLPLDASFNDIFTIFNSTDVVGPNSGAGPVAGWDGGVFTNPDFDLVNYDILLTGSTPLPEPGTLVLISAGIVGIFLRRKQLARS